MGKCPWSKVYHLIWWACLAISGTGSLVFIVDLTAAGWKCYRAILKCYRAILPAHIQPNASKHIGQCFTVQMDDLQHTWKQPKARKWKVLQWRSQSPNLNPIEHACLFLKAKCHQNKQDLKTPTGKIWKSITREETKNLVMSLGSRLQTILDCKEFATKYKKT